MSVGIRQPGTQRPVNVGPYIMAAAAIHSVVLVLGMFAFVEYQKAQVQTAVEKVRTEIETRSNAAQQKGRQYDEPADRRGK
jgi:hypothetical protein